MKTLFRSLVLVCALVLVCSQAMAQTYPNKPIKLIVGYPPGGGTDNLARIIAPKLAESLGKPVIIENKAGANAIIAAEYAARAAPDGYTLFVASDSEMVLNIGLYKHLPYDPVKDFVPITKLSSNPLVFAVNPNVPAHSIKELIALGKAKPGTLFYSAGAPVFQIAGELFKKQMSVDIMHVPYKGAAASVAAGVSGQVAMVSTSIGPLLGQLRAGTLRGLAITSRERSPLLPDVPTMIESGAADFVIDPWTGFFAPAGTPPAIIEKLNGAMRAVLELKDVNERMAKLGVDLGGMPSAEFAALLKSDLEKWPKMVRELGIHAD